MSRTRPISATFAATLLLVLAVPAVASADAFHDIYNDYAKTGRIDACKYSSKQLKDARKQVPGDIAQYAPDFPDALDAAAQQRAAGGCAKKSGSKPGTVAPTTGAGAGSTTGGSGQTPAPATQKPATPAASTPAPSTAAAPAATPAPQTVLPDALASSSRDNGDSKTPTPLLLLAILGALALLAASTLAAIRWWAFDPPWLGRLRHSVAEAGWRTSAVWAEFTDWVRFGR